jgi:hypothetical protein
VAAPKSKRNRKRRKRDTAPRAVPSPRREIRAERTIQTDVERRRARRQLGREGERPEGPFGGVPVSEVAILAGIVSAVVGFITGGGTPLVAGLIICALGVFELTLREHLAGFRSHTALLAGMPAVGVEVALVAIFGEPKQRALLLVVVVPVFGILFWALRKRFLIARQARVARTARGTAPPPV